MIDPYEFRRVLGHFPSGVTVVTTLRPGAEPCGLTVNAFSSVSLEPPLVMVCVEREAVSHDCIIEYGRFAVNMLTDEEGERLARHFAQPQVGDKFDGVAWSPSRAGVPILDRALAWVDCTVVKAVEGGDHTIFIAEVTDGDAHEGHPLVYYRGRYGRFDP
ncbi:MAG: flavin reductase [Gemmatimonas sp.]|nr:flavin reductase [Gemmatimonas sp.]